MKNLSKILIVTLSLSSASLVFAAEDNGYSLSLSDAIRLAFRNNRDIQIQEQEVKAAAADVVGARSSFLPQINATAGYSRVGSVLSMSSAQSSKKDMGIFTGYKDDHKLGIGLEQIIYNGGANTASYRQSRVKLSIQSETLRARKLDAEFETKRLYYGLLLAQETERIAQDLLDQARSHYDEVKKKYDQGTVSRFDLLQSKVQVSKIVPEVIRAKSAAELIAAELKKLLGIKMLDAISLTEGFVYAPIKIDEPVFLETAYRGKPEMRLMAQGVDVNRWAIDMAKAGHKPQVNVSAGYNYRSDDITDMVNSRHNNWNAGVTVTVPLFDGFSTKAKVDAAKARYAQAQLAQDDFRDQVAVDIKQACLDLEKAQAIIDSQKDNIDEAKEALAIAEVSYANGEGTNLDVLDAQVSLSQVEKNLSEGIYDYLMARAFLDRNMGQGFTEEAGHETKD